jgi:hypothetical protein
VDGDVFWKVKRIGRDAAATIIAALNGEPWNPFCAERCMDRLLSVAPGLPSLRPVLDELSALNAAPLLAQALAEHCATRIAEAVASAKGTELDLRLKRIAQACVLGGVFDEREIVTRFCVSILQTAVIYGRGGVLEQVGHLGAAEGGAMLQPIAVAAAETLLQRPDAQRLGLATRHARLTPESNLLGAP